MLAVQFFYMHIQEDEYRLHQTKGPYGQFTVCELAKKRMPREDCKNLVCTLTLL